MQLLLEAPLNSLSFGNVSYNICRELMRKGIEVGLFPIGNPDLSAYNVPEDLKSFLESSIKYKYHFLKKDIPSLKMWHLNGSENRKNPEQYLYTFYECSEPTKTEIQLASAQNKTIFGSSYAKNKFVDAGVEAEFAPLGFDEDFYATDKKYLEGVIHFGLMGKFEKRKHTGRIIQSWLKKYGNNNKYQLTCCINNPFFKPEQMNEIIKKVLEGKRYTNINFLPRLEKNSEVNEFLNSIDIDLTGLSGAEGWNLPAFNATALGKWSIVLNETSHKDWANKDNSILVDSNGTFPCYDHVFFKEGIEYNQGVFFNWDEESVIAAMEKAETKVGQINTLGQKLSETMTYRNTVDSILSHVFKD
jgi:hypothetical protein